jgi:hypothetical protein
MASTFLLFSGRLSGAFPSCRNWTIFASYFGVASMLLLLLQSILLIDNLAQHYSSLVKRSPQIQTPGTTEAICRLSLGGLAYRPNISVLGGQYKI